MKTTYHNPTLLVLYLILFSSTTFAQTPKENLEKGVETYNALREYAKTLSREAITADNLKDIKNRVERGTALLDKVVKEGNADQIKVARYFKNNFQYELGFSYGMKGDNKTAYDVYKALENSIAVYKASDFPMLYEYFGKNFKITWDNFAVTQAEYYTGMGEVSFNIGKYDDAYNMTKRSLGPANRTNWLKYISINKILDIRAKKKALVADEEFQDYALQSMKSYEALSTDDKKIVADNKYPTWERGYKIFDNLINEGTTTPNIGSKIGDAAQILSRGNENEKAAKFYAFALKNGWGTNIQLKNEVLPVARAINAKALGLEALARLVTTSTDCDALEIYGKDYVQFGDNTRAEEMKKRVVPCRKKAAEEAERVATERKKEQDRLERERRKANREGHFFVGMYVIPLFSKPTDFGGVINFGTKKFLTEVSFLNITKKKENTADLELREIKDVPPHMWNGFFTHVAFKTASKNSTRDLKSYSGLLFGYNQRTFEPFSSNVTNTTTKQITSKKFEPKSKQYIAMVNLGVLMLKTIGVDAYFGIGAAYNKFDGGNAEVWAKDNFTIEDKLVANRKNNYFSFTMRVGISIGFGK